MPQHSRCDTEFNIDQHLVKFMSSNTYFCELSRHVHKVPTEEIPTAGVCFDPQHDEITLYWNPKWLDSLTTSEVQGILLHEFYHVTFGHITVRRKEPPMMWNIATDLAINSLIDANHKQNGADEVLPPGCLMPGEWPPHPEGRDLTEEEKKACKLGQLIASFPKMMPSEWYFMKLQEAAEKDKQEGGTGLSFGDDELVKKLFKSIDDHDCWDDLPDELREYAEQRVKAAVEKAAKAADQSSSGWGTIPAEIRDDIKRWVCNDVDWRKVLRQFVGMLERGAKVNSIKRINKRYPYVHPGTKRGYVAKLLVAIDQSGSVGNEMLYEFFGELGALTRKTSVTVLPFDCAANEKDMFEWRKGQRPTLERVKCGGTDFSAPTAVFNDPKNRGRWDGILIFTDGEAPKPIAARGKRGWVLGKGAQLAFGTDELQIFVSNEKRVEGAYR